MSDKKSDLFQTQQHALDKASQTCPKCNEPLTFRSGKAGAFLGCTAYPKCDYIKPLNSHKNQSDAIHRVIDGSSCPKCNNLLAVKQGKFGLFIGCTAFPDCDFIDDQNASEAKNKSECLEQTCPKCEKGRLVERLSRFGKKFFACSAYPKCEYAVNFQPVSQSCPKCQWPIMLKKTLRGKDKLVCPQNKCKHQIDAI